MIKHFNKMDKINISIEGYKCFKTKTTFALNNITFLTGANSAGKSSVIQSILIGKAISEANLENPDSMLVKNIVNNDTYSLNLGSYDDISNRESITGAISISIGSNQFGVSLDSVDDNNESIKFSIDTERRQNLRDVFSRGFVYLNAERMSPLYEYKSSKSTDFCDCHGSNAGDVFNKHLNDTILPLRSLDHEDDKIFLKALDVWCEYIFPGVIVRVKPVTSESYKIIVRNDVATNVGFGITYALPILISGLLVPEGGMLIVENPEAHLHAKAQSNLGYFLAQMASAGVRVLVETHSEHIVNGMRRYVTEDNSGISNEDVTIYFFQNCNGEKSIKQITMDSMGNLSDFPKDFFDQVRQDMLALMEKER